MSYRIARLLTTLAARMNHRAAAIQSRLALRLQTAASRLLTESNRASARAAESRATANRIESINQF